MTYLKLGFNFTFSESNMLCKSLPVVAFCYLQGRCQLFHGKSSPSFTTHGLQNFMPSIRLKQQKKFTIKNEKTKKITLKVKNTKKNIHTLFRLNSKRGSFLVPVVEALSTITFPNVPLSIFTFCLNLFNK